ncbi:MAG: type II toxin-antitoxin system HicA family toxin [Bacillota bacterium]
MRRLPVISGTEAVKALERVGFRQVSQKGSHVKLRGYREGQLRTVIVPTYEELAPGTLHSILKQAGVSVEELVGLL